MAPAQGRAQEADFTAFDLQVHDDQIFFGWALHRAASGAAPLFRGMVVQFDAVAPRPLCDALAGGELGELGGGGGGGEGAAGGEVVPGRVLAIGKLKCLNYLVRTFGVRNLLPTLLEVSPLTSCLG